MNVTVREPTRLGDLHLRTILRGIEPGDRVLIVGTGGWTSQVLNHVPAGCAATALEDGHDRAAIAGDSFDVAIVDGRVREALVVVRGALSAGGRVYLHGAEPPWHDEGKLTYVEHGTIGPCPDASGSHLWYGGLRPRRTAGAGHMPVIVSYFTSDTPYEALAARLRESCEALGLRYVMVARPPAGSWEANCAAKGEVCLDAWQALDTPILWVDADAVMRRRPDLLAADACDFAIHKWKGWRFASGTVFFGRSRLSGALLERWVERCRREPRVWDQVHLDLAWEDVVTSQPLHTMWLPRAYCQIFDAPIEGDDDIVVEHFQASRDLKKAVTDGPTMPRPDGSEALCRARRASRPCGLS